MEGVGIAASIVTLLEVIAGITKTTTRLCRDIHDAPTEFAALNIRLPILHAELEALEHLTVTDLDRILPRTLRSSMLLTLHLGDKVLKEIQRRFEKTYSRSGMYKRLRWSLFDHSLAEKHLERLRNVESSLTFILQVVIINGQKRTLEELESIKVQIFQPTTGRRCIGRASIEYDESLKRQGPPELNRFTSAYSCLGYLETFGITGSIVCSSGDRYTLYSFSIRSHLPFPTIFGENILAIEVSFKMSYLCRSISIQDKSTVAVRTVVPNDAEIMTACAAGDLRRVSRLFADGKARPEDMTASNSTPLRFAIESGNAEFIKFLLDNGPNVNGTFGAHQTSPIAWALHHKQYDIFCLLLRYGANLDHMSAMSWTPPDTRGWTLLHIAASAGHDQIVLHLLSLGADAYTTSRPFMSYMPESLFNRRCTPEEVAEAQSPERKERFLQAVRTAGRGATPESLSRVTTVEELYYDAKESLDWD